MPSTYEPGQPHKVHLSGAQETLLIPLYARALDSRSSHPILGDKKADEMVRMIDYDFEKLKGFGNRDVLVARAKQLDAWTDEFLRSQPDAVVLNLGCGLDSRVTRLAPPSGVGWFDLDYPDVILERQKFYSNRDGYTMLESPITELAWLDRVPRGRPVMVLADGVLEYLAAGDVKTLLNALTDRFISGQIAFDVMSSFAIESGRASLKAKMGAEHKWAVDDVRTVESMDPKLKMISNKSLFASRDLPTGYRLTFGVASLLPRFRNMIRLLRFEF